MHIKALAGVAEGAQTWGGHFWIFIYNALSAALRATSFALAHKLNLGSQYSDKLKIHLTSPSTWSSTFIIKIWKLNCDFLGSYGPIGNIIWGTGSLNSPPQAKIFWDSVLKMMLQKQFVNGPPHKLDFSEGRTIIC